jgi:hypothetical protein
MRHRAKKPDGSASPLLFIITFTWKEGEKGARRIKLFFQKEKALKGLLFEENITNEGTIQVMKDTDGG